MKMAIGEDLSDVQVADLIGGADGSRTHDLLNAIIFSFSGASNLRKKSLRIHTPTAQQSFWVLSVLIQKIRTEFGQVFDLTRILRHQVFSLQSPEHAL